MELKSSPETDDYRYFDPKLIKSDGYSKIYFKPKSKRILFYFISKNI
jgi:hypothetical protein